MEISLNLGPEESVCMLQPSPTLFCCDIITSSIHSLEQGPLDQELLSVVRANTRNVGGYTILRNGSTHGYIAWDIHRGPVANNIPATSSSFGQVEAGFVHKNQGVRGLISSTPLFSTIQ